MINDETYVAFSVTGANVVMDSICGQGNALGPGGPGYTYVYIDPTGINVVAHTQWAPNQSGYSLEGDSPNER